MITIFFIGGSKKKFSTNMNYSDSIFYFRKQGSFAVIEELKCINGTYQLVGWGNRVYFPLSKIKRVEIDEEGLM